MIKCSNCDNTKCKHGFWKNLNCGYCETETIFEKDFFNWEKYPDGIPDSEAWIKCYGDTCGCKIRE